MYFDFVDDVWVVGVIMLILFGIMLVLSEKCLYCIFEFMGEIMLIELFECFCGSDD